MVLGVAWKKQNIVLLRDSRCNILQGLGKVIPEGRKWSVAKCCKKQLGGNKAGCDGAFHIKIPGIWDRDKHLKMVPEKQTQRCPNPGCPFGARTGLSAAVLPLLTSSSLRAQELTTQVHNHFLTNFLCGFHIRLLGNRSSFRRNLREGIWLCLPGKLHQNGSSLEVPSCAQGGMK